MTNDTLARVTCRKTLNTRRSLASKEALRLRCEFQTDDEFSEAANVRLLQT